MVGGGGGKGYSKMGAIFEEKWLMKNGVWWGVKTLRGVHHFQNLSISFKSNFRGIDVSKLFSNYSITGNRP